MLLEGRKLTEAVECRTEGHGPMSQSAGFAPGAPLLICKLCKLEQGAALPWASEI